MSKACLLGIDWGTTNRRIYAIDARGGVVERLRDGCGVKSLQPGDYAADLAGQRQTFGALPAICAGMVGSDIGWSCAGYVPCPASLPGIAERLLLVEEQSAIVPGVSFEQQDVMRGEEVQALGALEIGTVPRDALICQPGTHCKWIELHDGNIVRFRTSMTGELHSLLRGHSLLAGQIQSPAAPNEAFQTGVDLGLSRELLHSLFTVRARALLAPAAMTDAASFTSGLLIGQDIAEQALPPDRSVYLIGEPPLRDLYATALVRCGCEVHVLDSERAFVAGIFAIWRMIR